ncbi:hypothetical protein J8L98_00565 [Pseudoalteromonas sp. MMG013]|uniref:hypothetical protein n=1 Tax=Pseudoalteromonas sp. MMG013 TaxID=2822687 RepID=UPI001B369C25|nr:hypothetical protein [Pseudoalteromonas sp. MMG013]MBQ4860180.1 hypothetical protein [Pseudoalteromonas sp. MMG013]
MKLKYITSILAISLSSVTFTTEATQAEATTASLGSLILDKAKSKFVSNVGSLLGDALFGSQGPQYVTLSEESLQAIQDRVRKEVIRDAEFDFISEFRSIDASMKHYSDTIAHTGEDLALLSSLLIKVNDLTNHRAIDSRYNDDYFYLADTYALAASLTVSIYTERYLTGSISKQSVSVKANQLANSLNTMFLDKKSADYPLRKRCDERDPYDQDTERYCVINDPYGNTIFNDSYDGQEEWYEWLDGANEAKEEYYQSKFAKIEEVIAKLRRF